MSEQFEKYVCWEEGLSVGQVINTEATRIEVLPFMATHTPMHGLTYVTATTSPPGDTDSGVFEILRERRRRDEHTFMVVQGVPGSGKSHLIRWLYERYLGLAGSDAIQEVVLLIQRENSSLLDALRQISESGLLDDARYADQIKQLKRAQQTLTDASLRNKLLNKFQEAALSVQQQADDGIPQKHVETFRGVDPTVTERLLTGAAAFLLERSVRDFLSREDGPVHRLAQSLTGDGKQGRSGQEMLIFNETDFELPSKVNDHLESLPPGDVVRRVASGLHERKQDRRLLAEFLNNMREEAIGEVTAFTVSDLKRMFDEVRRVLRQEGKALVLFVEDITAFTGLDMGLLDVISIQHTGEYSDMCRITSVIGVTDDYYATYFREHLRARMTYHLRLNGPEDNGVSPLVATKHATAIMTARYLNAMRVPQARWEQWQAQRIEVGDTVSLPNACVDCPVRTPCHAAFGAVRLVEDEPESAIGLYPFNAEAVWAMFGGLDSSNLFNTDTPRALLDHVIGYVMRSHADKVPLGHFPPAANEISGMIRVLRPMSSRYRSQAQANGADPMARKQLDGLLTFWGDQTTEVVMVDGETTLGGLRQTVFTVFGVQVKSSAFSNPASAPAPQATTVAAGSVTPDVPTVAQDVLPPSTEPALHPPENPHIQPITDWRAGNPLNGYERLARWVADVASAGIDWYVSPIALPVRVDSRVTQRNIVIEDQAAPDRSRTTYTLPRNDVTSSLLEGLSDLQTREASLSDQDIGFHVLTISAWLHEQSDDLHALVVKPLDTHPEEPLPPVDLMTYVLTMTAAICGVHIEFMGDPHQIYWRLASIVRKGLSVDTNRRTKWDSLSLKITENVEEVAKQWLATLDVPQGSTFANSPASREFIDAAWAVDAIKRFQSDGWQVPFDSKVLAAVSESKDWAATAKLWLTFEKGVGDAIDAEIEWLDGVVRDIDFLLGEHDAAALHREIVNLLESDIKLTFVLPQGDWSGQLERLLTEVKGFLAAEIDDLNQYLWICANRSDMHKLNEDFLQPLIRLEAELNKLALMDERTLKTERSSANAGLREEVAALLQELAVMLEAANHD